MKNMTIEAIASACGGQLVNADNVLNTEIKGAVLDSRLVEEGFLFFATKGERVDGHSFMGDVFAKGALCCVCENVPEGITGPCILVEDSFVALKEIAKYYRQQLSVKVVGITGSVGKTTTKEFISSVLSTKYSVLKTEKNFNNEVGLPLTILKIRDEHQVAVVEMGISDFGEMSRLTAIARPDVAVITNIGQCHLEKLIDRDGVLKAKTEIFEGLSDDGRVVLFGDDDKLVSVTDVKGIKPVFYGLEDNNDITAKDIVNRGLWGSEATICEGEESFKVSVPLPGKHMVYNALAATAVGRIMDLTTEQIVEGIESMESMGGRSNIIEANNIVIIDDCYNANPVSTKAAIDLLGEAVTPKVAILGDMFELGSNEAMLHREVGIYAGEAGIDTLIFIGELSKHAYAGANSTITESSYTKAYYYPTVDQALEELSKLIKKDDAVLIKASHGMHFEQIVDLLKSEECADSFEARTEKLFKRTETITSDDVEMTMDPEDDPSKFVAPKMEGADAWVKPISEMNKSKEKPQKKVDEEQIAAWKLVMYIAIAVVVIVAIVGIILGVNHKNNYNATTGGLMTVVESNQLKGKAGLGLKTYSEDSNSLVFDTSSPRCIKTDGKNIFYTLNPEGDFNFPSSFDLYSCTSKGSKNKLVADKVSSYSVLSKGKVIYNQQGNLYVKNVSKGTTTLVSSEVAEYVVADNGKDVCYRKYSGDLVLVDYTKPDGAVVIDSGVARICGSDNKLSNICYDKAGSLYALKGKKEPVCLVNDYYNEMWIVDNTDTFKLYILRNGELYFYKAGDKSASLVTNKFGYMIGEKSNDGFLMYLGDDPTTLYAVYEGSLVECKDFFVGGLGNKVAMNEKSKLLYFINVDTATGTSSLMSVSFGTFSKGKVTEEESKVTDICYMDGKTNLICKEGMYGAKDLYRNNILVAEGVDPYSLVQTKYKDGFVFAYANRDSEGHIRLAVIDGNEVKEIGSSDDMDLAALSCKKIYYTQMQDGLKNVYLYNGSKSKLKIEGVGEFHYIEN